MLSSSESFIEFRVISLLQKTSSVSSLVLFLPVQSNVPKRVYFLSDNAIKGLYSFVHINFQNIKTSTFQEPFSIDIPFYFLNSVFSCSFR